MSETERLLHNLVSATVNVALAQGATVLAAEKQRDEAVTELAKHLDANSLRPVRNK